jgi:hypothetical protein
MKNRRMNYIESNIVVLDELFSTGVGGNCIPGRGFVKPNYIRYNDRTFIFTATLVVPTELAIQENNLGLSCSFFI